MRRLKKLIHVLLVIGAAALMSVPFKRVPPQDTKKNAGRGEWQLVKPDIPFRDLLKADAAAARGKSGQVGASAAEKAGQYGPRDTPAPSGARRPIVADPVAPAPADQSAPAQDVPASSGIPTPSVSYSRPSTPVPVPEPVPDREAITRARALRIPRITPLPEPSERLDDDASVPSLPAEFTPL